MKVRYLYSACVSIETEDCTVLCDPWFGEAYDGSWVQWPRIEHPLDVCGPADYVYVSHVHPDHFDTAFLTAYLAKYPNAQVIIAEMKPALLERKLRARDIIPIVATNPYQHGDTSLYCIPNHANAGVNIDSALVVFRKGLSVANFNDNPFDMNQAELANQLSGGHPTVALLPFVGAGPWPQCYEFDTPADQLKAAEAKKQKYLDLFSRYCQALQPQVAVPFAGQYWLHGPHLDLNPLRGMADATECKQLWPKVWVPRDGGQSVLTIEDGADKVREPGDTWWNSERIRPYDWPTVRKALDYMHILTMDEHQYRAPAYRYEREIQVPVERLPLLKLLQSASVNAAIQFFKRPGPVLHLFIKASPLSQWFYVTSKGGPVIEVAAPELLPRIEVTLDARYLFGMLTRLYNANSVRIGGLCKFKCVPNVYDKELDDLFGEYFDSLRV